MQALHQLGQTGARPGPLAIGFQAGLVDVDNQHRRHRTRPLIPALELVKLRQPQALQRQRIHQPEQKNAQRQEQHQRGGAQLGQRITAKAHVGTVVCKRGRRALSPEEGRFAAYFVENCIHFCTKNIHFFIPIFII